MKADKNEMWSSLDLIGTIGLENTVMDVFGLATHNCRLLRVSFTLHVHFMDKFEIPLASSEHMPSLLFGHCPT